MKLKLNFSQITGGAWQMHFAVKNNATAGLPCIDIPYRLEHVKSNICAHANSLIPTSAHYALNLLNAELANLEQQRRDLQMQIFNELEPKLSKFVEDYPSLYPEYFI